MSDDVVTMPVHYLRQIADMVRERGASVGAWLTESGLRPEDLEAPVLALDFQRFCSLIRGALSVTDEPALGLLLGGRLRATAHGMVGYAALNSGTMRQALELLERYTRLRTSLVSISVVFDAKVTSSVRVRFDEPRPLGDLRRPVLEAIMVTIKNLLGTLSTGSCRVSSVAFPFLTPPYAALARELFGCAVEYDRSWAELVLPAANLDVPLETGDPEAFQEAARICQRELDRLTAEESLSARVRRVLLGGEAGFPSLQVTARLLGLTPRTLHRRLLEEGSSYRQLVEQTRRALAIEHVQSGRLGMEEIAYMLGYSDLSNFRRAFKRWEAVPPSTYRSAHGPLPSRNRKR